MFRGLGYGPGPAKETRRVKMEEIKKYVELTSEEYSNFSECNIQDDMITIMKATPFSRNPNRLLGAEVVLEERFGDAYGWWLKITPGHRPGEEFKVSLGRYTLMYRHEGWNMGINESKLDIACKLDYLSTVETVERFSSFSKKIDKREPYFDEDKSYAKILEFVKSQAQEIYNDNNVGVKSMNKMNKSMMIYELKEEKVKPPKIQRFRLANGVEIPAICVGEKGRGRRCGVLPVKLLPESFQRWKNGEEVTIKAVMIGKTRTGRPKLIEAREAEDNEHVVLVLRTPIGFRGYNDHKFSDEPALLAEGRIAQGEAGAMGSGEQLIVVAPVGSTVTVEIGGRRYGAPKGYVYNVKSVDEITVMTDEESELLSDQDISELLE